MSPTELQQLELRQLNKTYARYVLITRIGWLIVLYILVVFAFRWWDPYQVFDSLKWKTDDCQTSARLGMANYLMASTSLIGKTKEEIIELLGEPYGLKPVGFHLSWYVGAGRGFFSFNSYFVISLDQEDRVKACAIYED